jgi:hypothetical protein
MILLARVVYRGMQVGTLQQQDRATRFAGLLPAGAAAFTVVLAAVIVIGLFPGGGGVGGPSLHPQHAPAAAGPHDLTLYRDIVDRMRHGAAYEPTAVAAPRRWGYPRRPFFTVRPPALATFLSWLPNENLGRVALAFLAVNVVTAWTLRLSSMYASPFGRVLGACALLAGVGAGIVVPGLSLVSETWTGLLIALSLAFRGERRFGAAVVLGFLAALIRELAVPYLVVMGLAALAERRRSEALAFLSAAGVALLALGLHGYALASLITGQDIKSPGWVRFGGWRFVEATVGWNVAAMVIGGAANAVLAPLGLIGAAGWKGPTGLRLALVLFGYTAGFMIIGRPDNHYWGLILAPLVAVGFCLSPHVLRDLLGGLGFRLPQAQVAQ